MMIMMLMMIMMIVMMMVKRNIKQILIKMRMKGGK